MTLSEEAQGHIFIFIVISVDKLLPFFSLNLVVRTLCAQNWDTDARFSQNYTQCVVYNVPKCSDPLKILQQIKGLN